MDYGTKRLQELLRQFEKMTQEEYLQLYNNAKDMENDVLYDFNIDIDDPPCLYDDLATLEG